MTRSLLVALVAIALAPRPVSAQGGPRRPWAPGESGLVLTADLGGGTAIGSGSQYTPNGRLELELGAGYDLPLATDFGIRPEFAVALGAAPTRHVALRPGVHVSLADLPFYLRAAGEWSTVRGAGRWRWILGGAGAELRVTGTLGAFAEADVGLPVARDAGIELLLRAGISLRL